MPSPKVVYVGTSNGGSMYNFAGSLKEFLQQDVLDFSFIGGREVMSLKEDLTSPEFTFMPPKVIVWETLMGHQTISRINDEWKDSIEESGASERAVINLADSFSEFSIKGSDYYLYLNFSDLSITNFKVVTKYQYNTIDSFQV